MSEYEQIKNNWNKYLLETEIAKMSENGELLEEGLKDLAAKLGKKYGIPAMVALQMLTAAAPAMAAGDVSPEREVPVAAAETEANESLNDINAALGFIHSYVGNKSSLSDRAEAEQDLMMVQKALAQGRTQGGEVDRDSLGEKDQKILDNIMKNVNKIQERDLELYGYYKDIGTKITIN